jgi:hypothetical protein
VVAGPAAQYQDHDDEKERGDGQRAQRDRGAPARPLLLTEFGVLDRHRPNPRSRADPALPG